MTVCKRWRHIVETTPALWTDIWLGHSPRPQRTTINQWLEYVEVQLNRSGNLPLNLNIMVECVVLEDALRVLNPHLSRCCWLGLRGPSEKDADQVKCSKLSVHTTLSAIHILLSSPFPALKFLSVDDISTWRLVRTDNDDLNRFVFVNAPNLISITSRCSALKVIVKCSHPPPFTPPSLQDLSLRGSWDDDPLIIPSDKLNLPNLKTLSLQTMDYVWQFLSALCAPQLENLVISCSLAYWPSAGELPTNISPLTHLRRLEWHTYSDSAGEEASLHCLFRHSTSLVSFAYIFDADLEGPSEWAGSAGSGSGDANIGAILNILFEQGTATAMLCPNLRSICFPSLNLDNVVRLIELRPALERISLQVRKTKDVIVTGAREEWRIKVDQMRWIKSQVEFVFPTLELSIGLQQEDDVVWDPEGTTDSAEGV